MKFFNNIEIISKMKFNLILIAFYFGATFSTIISHFLVNKYQFIAVMAIVMADMFFGMSRALNEGTFKVKKAFKGIYMVVAFWLLLAVVLLIEKGFPFASFLSEAILLPILLFQLISILKNMQILGLISNDTLNNILDKIDKQKGTKKEVF